MRFRLSYAASGIGIVLFLICILVQFSVPDIIGADGQLHARVTSMMIKKGGFLHSLPQAHFSWFVDSFSDKDFFFHIYLIPFVLVGGMVQGTKFASAVMILLLMTVFVWLVFRYISRSIAPYVAFSICLSPLFLRDMSEARPFVLAVAFTLVGISSVIEKKHTAIFIISLIYGMWHLSAWTFPLFVIGYVGYQWISEGKGDLRMVLLSLAGYGVSLFVHPNFPHNVFYLYLNGILVPLYAVKGGLELGAEFFPLTTQAILYAYPMITLLPLYITGVRVLATPRLRQVTIGWILASLYYGFFAVFSQRNLTHAYPILLLSIGAYATDVVSSFAGITVAKKFRLQAVNTGIFALIFLFGIFTTASNLQQRLYVDSMYARHYHFMSDTMKKQIPAGSRIFHANWSDSQYFIGLSPEYEYFVTFDPIYMQTFSPVLYADYRSVSFGKSDDPVGQIEKEFGSHYAYASKIVFPQFAAQLKQHSRVKILAEDSIGILAAFRNDDQSP